MWWRRAALALNGTADVRGSWKGSLPYPTYPLDSTPTGPCNKVATSDLARAIGLPEERAEGVSAGTSRLNCQTARNFVYD
jgi:hypothetical protein